MVIKEIKALCGAINALDRTINAVDRSVTLAIRIYDRVQVQKDKAAKAAKEGRND